ncbi:MAG: hypothetical protein V7K72_18465, partial [Nostoc sp.]
NIGNVYLPCHDPDRGEAISIKFDLSKLFKQPLKSFLRSFAPTTTEMVDKIISVALHLINPQHLRNWFASCCYCTS